jgi:hypothetical protein
VDKIKIQNVISSPSRDTLVTPTKARAINQHAAANRFFVVWLTMFDPPSKFLLLLSLPVGTALSSSLSCLLLSLLFESGAKKFVRRNLVPQALHKHGLLAGPRLHCGESNAPQWSHGPPGLHPGGNSLAFVPLALSSPPLLLLLLLLLVSVSVAFSFFFSFPDETPPPPFVSFFLFFPDEFVVSFVVLGLWLPSFALSVPSEFAPC